MKKVLFSFVTIAVCSMLLISSCKKENVKTSDQSFENFFEAMAPVPGDGSAKNYCMECGSSTEKTFCCNFQGFNEEGQAFGMCALCGIVMSSGPCYAAHLNDSLIAYNLDTVSFVDAYEVRDSLLIMYELGQKYITTYYYLTNVVNLHSTITFSNLIQHLTFTNDMKDAAYTLMYGTDNDIVITESLKDDAISLIDYYRTFETSSTEYQDILDGLETDITTFANKTRAQVLTILSN